MTPIRRGDGTGLDPKGYTEIRKGDGAVLWSAIPDSGGTHQWNWTAGSDTTVSDQIGNLDLNFTGLDWNTGAGTKDTFGLLDGVDDYAGLGTDAFISLINDAEGTIQQWVRPDNNNDGVQSIIASKFTDETRDMFFGIAYDVDSYRFAVSDSTNVNSTNITSGDPTNDVGDWINLAAVHGDGGTSRLFIARPPDYDLTELGTDSTIDSESGEWNNEVSVGRETYGDKRYFEGGIDIGYFDTAARSQSSLQNWIDDTKSFYE